ncbi:phenylphosphate carboxylase subunit gamma [Chloroflexota bacterium]
MAEYVTKLRNLGDLQDGANLELFIQDLAPGPRKYDGERVKAVVSSSIDDTPSGDVLWVRSALGRMQDKRWGLKITERLGVAMPGRPYAD